MDRLLEGKATPAKVEKAKREYRDALARLRRQEVSTLADGDNVNWLKARALLLIENLRMGV
jgi:hypothetical protein